jgi:hypothetical protein
MLSVYLTIYVYGASLSRRKMTKWELMNPGQKKNGGSFSRMPGN